MGFTKLSQIDFDHKTVLLRCDLNVPMENWRVTDSTRIERLTPTIKYLTEYGAKVILLSHFGRPKGLHAPDLSMKFLSEPLSTIWGVKVHYTDNCIGSAAINTARNIPYGEVALLENLRFHPGEEANDPEFASQLAMLGDIYVNDAFSVSHRAHASTVGLAQLLPAAAGFLMEEELNALSRLLDNPQPPLTVIVGGAKVSTKLELLYKLVEKTDTLVLGGGMANTFLYAQGIDVKQSLYEAEMATQANSIMEKAADLGCEIVLPVDALVATDLRHDIEHQICDVQAVPDGHMILDIGPQTLEMIRGKLQECSSLVWNGPLGAFEIPPFDQGTTALALHAAELTQIGAITSIAGGGDTIAALDHAKVKDQFSYVSTAGGAFLEWLEGKELPGVKALNDRSGYNGAAARTGA
jgi:phosphoglycerate kinase